MELGFFRRIFSVLHSRFGDTATGEIPVGHFSRIMGRLFQILDNKGEIRMFDASVYDLDDSGAVGWWEFVACWKDHEFFIQLTPAERVFLSIEDASSCVIARG